MATSSVPLAADGPLVRGESVDDLADVGVWYAQLDGNAVVVQEIEGELVAVQAAMEPLVGGPGMPVAPAYPRLDGSQLVALVVPEGDWLANVLDARRKLPVMPPRAVLTIGKAVADALERVWSDRRAPPVVRPDVRPVALRVGRDGSFTFGALRFAGRLARDAGDGKGPSAAEDTRGEDLFLLGTMLYEMATRRRFGRGGTTAVVQRHHVQRRLTAASAELDAFGDRRAEFVDLLLSLVGPERDVDLPFAKVSRGFRELLLRVDGEGLVEWTRAVFPDPTPEDEEDESHETADVPPPRMPVSRPAPLTAPRGVAFAIGTGPDATEELTPLLVDRTGGDEPTDLPPRVLPAPPALDDATETSEEEPSQPEATPAVPVNFPRPSPLKIPAPSFASPHTPVEAFADEEDESLPENVIPLRGESRPGRRRGGLVPKALDAAEPVASTGTPAPRSAPSRSTDPAPAPRGGARSRRSPLFLLGVGLVAIVPLLALGGAWWTLSRRTPPSDEVALAPSAAQREPPAPPSAPSVADPTPPAPAASPPPVDPPAAAPSPASPADPPATVPAVPPPVVPPVSTSAPEAVAATRPPPVRTPTAPSSAPPSAPPVEARVPTPPPEAGPWGAAPAPAVDPTAPVLTSFGSKPGGVLVSVDGAPRGTTPIQVLLTPGSHSLSYETDGKVYAREIQVSATRNSWTLNLAQGKIE